MKKVLILYGTRYGTTRDTSEKIRDFLRKKEIEVSLMDIAEEQENQIPPLNEFNGVLLGTGIKISMWTRKIKKFTKKHLKELEKRNFKFGFFVCCGTASKKEKINEAKVSYIDKKMGKIGLTYDTADAFGPIYDFSETSPFSNMTKKMIKSGLIKEEGWESVENKLYDLRDLDQIQKYAEDFATLI